MRIITWGVGFAITISATSAYATPTTDLEANEHNVLEGAATDEEPLGEVSQAATTAGTACRVTCATSYAAACLQV